MKSTKVKYPKPEIRKTNRLVPGMRRTAEDRETGVYVYEEVEWEDIKVGDFIHCAHENMPAYKVEEIRAARGSIPTFYYGTGRAPEWMMKMDGIFSTEYHATADHGKVTKRVWHFLHDGCCIDSHGCDSGMKA